MRHVSIGLCLSINERTIDQAPVPPVVITFSPRRHIVMMVELPHCLVGFCGDTVLADGFGQHLDFPMTLTTTLTPSHWSGIVFALLLA